MKTNKKPWPIGTVSHATGIRRRIDTNPDFQRPAVWSKSQKQLLIDTILREYDVPKMYWRKIGASPDRYDVVDGQQRLRAIWGFVDGEFTLPKNSEAVDGLEVAGCSYESLPDDLRVRFDTYALDVVVLEDTDEDEVREMFLRLQNGTSLKSQEKRNAMGGAMRQFVRTLTQHAFFNRVGFANTRFTHDLVAAQMVCLEIAGGPVNVKDADLNRMYEANRAFDVNGKVAKAVRRTLDLLADVFVDKTPELERFNVIALYCVFAELQRLYVLEGIKSGLRGWFIEFESRRRVQEALDEEHGHAEWVAYKERISHSTDAQESIRFRLDFVLRNLLENFPDLPLKDNQRGFTHLQKLAVFRRDNQICQVRLRCDGVRVEWDNWHCDHRMPWSAGGATTVANGQVSCPACNLAKGADWAPAPPATSEPSDSPSATDRIRKDAVLPAVGRAETSDAIGFSFDGRFYACRNAIETLQGVFNVLIDRDPAFADRFAGLPKHGRTRRYLAKTADELYFERPDLVRECSEKLDSGWWMSTNHNRRTIDQIIGLACEVAELEYGRMLVAHLGN